MSSCWVDEDLLVFATNHLALGSAVSESAWRLGRRLPTLDEVEEPPAEPPPEQEVVADVKVAATPEVKPSRGWDAVHWPTLAQQSKATWTKVWRVADAVVPRDDSDDPLYRRCEDLAWGLRQEVGWELPAVAAEAEAVLHEYQRRCLEKRRPGRDLATVERVLAEVDGLPRLFELFDEALASDDAATADVCARFLAGAAAMMPAPSLIRPSFDEPRRPTLGERLAATRPPKPTIKRRRRRPVEQKKVQVVLPASPPPRVIKETEDYPVNEAALARDRAKAEALADQYNRMMRQAERRAEAAAWRNERLRVLETRRPMLRDLLRRDQDIWMLEVADRASRRVTAPPAPAPADDSLLRDGAPDVPTDRQDVPKANIEHASLSGDSHVPKANVEHASLNADSVASAVPVEEEKVDVPLGNELPPSEALPDEEVRHDAAASASLPEDVPPLVPPVLVGEDIEFASPAASGAVPEASPVAADPAPEGSKLVEEVAPEASPLDPAALADDPVLDKPPPEEPEEGTGDKTLQATRRAFVATLSQAGGSSRFLGRRRRVRELAAKVDQLSARPQAKVVLVSGRELRELVISAFALRTGTLGDVDALPPVVRSILNDDVLARYAALRDHVLGVHGDVDTVEASVAAQLIASRGRQRFSPETLTLREAAFGLRAVHEYVAYALDRAWRSFLRDLDVNSVDLVDAQHAHFLRTAEKMCLLDDARAAAQVVALRRKAVALCETLGEDLDAARRDFAATACALARLVRPRGPDCRPDPILDECLARLAYFDNGGGARSQSLLNVPQIVLR